MLHYNNIYTRYMDDCNIGIVGMYQCIGYIGTLCILIVVYWSPAYICNTVFQSLVRFTTPVFL